MNPVRISAVSYLNTFPFVYGILDSGILENYRLDLDVPSVCAEKMKKGEADIALVPVGAVPEMKGREIITNFCLGAIRDVRTVLLLSNKPLNEIKTIFLDSDSRTSVQLVKVLAANFWNIQPAWKDLNPGEAEHPEELESLVAIGDKTFGIAGKFPFVYDLAGEWIKFTGLPFVFAVWMASPDLPFPVIESFTNALEFGIRHKQEALYYFKEKLPEGVDCLSYLEKNISYHFDDEKQKGLEKFLKYLG